MKEYQEKEKKNRFRSLSHRISVHIANRDRHAELGLLLQSLRTQTFQDFDVVILDENETPIVNNYFLMSLINRMKLENHCMNIIRNDLRLGVCHARNKLIKEDYFDDRFICRLDDDVILERDYLKKLLDVINLGYDIVSGVTPLLGHPELKRNISTVKPIINKKEFDKKGDIIKHGDDCGCCYTEEEIIQADEFRSCALMKKEVTDKVKYEDNLSPVGFREEAFFSLRARELGFKIGVHTGAVAYHLQSPSGGCRLKDYAEKVQSDDKYFKKWAKEWWKRNV